ncbi:MAG: fatty acid desaturase [Deltaproteobacteria bacterium]|nr:fatty acid desaturase [Deltaproteobacteria bacterium]
MQAVPSEVLQRAYQRRPLYLLKLPFFWGLVFAMGFAANEVSKHTSTGLAFVASLVAGVLIGSLVRGLGSIGHDAAHGTVSRSPTLTYLIGFWAWSATLMSYTLYRTYHLDHHRIVNMPHDVDRLTVSRFTKSAKLSRAIRVVIYLGMYPIYWLFSVQRYVRKMTLAQKVRMNLELLAVAGCIVGLSQVMVPVAFWTVMITQLVVGAFFASITSMCEHFGIAYHADHAYSSRTYGTSSALLDWLWSGTTFHNEHHKYPGIPWYNLKQFHFEALPYYSAEVKANIHTDFVPLAWGLLKRAATLDPESESEIAERDRERLRESVPELRPQTA